MGEMDRVPFRDSGEPVTRRQRAAIFATEADSNVGEFDMPQGSWQPKTSYSGTTHTRAGVCDLWFPGIGDNDATRLVVRKIRGIGKQAAFLRGPVWWGGNFSMWHIHTLDLDTRQMDGNAQWQVREYKAGNNGLDAGVNDPLPWRPENFKPFNFDAWAKVMELHGRVEHLNDRIENKVDSLESLRRERDHYKRILHHQLNERF